MGEDRPVPASRLFRRLPEADLRGRDGLALELFRALVARRARPEALALADHLAATLPSCIGPDIVRDAAALPAPDQAARLAAALLRRARPLPPEVLAEMFGVACIPGHTRPSEAALWRLPEGQDPAEWLIRLGGKLLAVNALEHATALFQEAAPLAADAETLRTARQLRLQALSLAGPGHVVAAAEGDADSGITPFFRDLHVALDGGASADGGLRRVAPDLVLRHAGGETCLVMFSGLRKMDFQDLMDGVFESLAARGVSLAFVSDSTRSLGLDGFGAWNGSATAAAQGLQAALAGEGLTRLATCGNSGGGLPALLYAGRAGAEGCLTFAGVSFLPDESTVKSARALTPLRRVLARVPPGPHDARPVLAAAPGTLCHCHVPRLSPFDMDQLENIQDLPNVTGFLHDTERHDVVRHMAEHDLLEPAAASFIEALGW